MNISTENMPVIVIKKNVDSVTAYAAEELKRYLKKIFGREPQIYDDEGIPDDVMFISMGYTALCEKHRLEYSGNIEGFRLVVKDDAGFILGEGRGLLYGTYELLNRIGVRFFTPEVESVPKNSFLYIENLNYSYAPALEYRDISMTPFKTAGFAVKSRLNGDISERECHGGGVKYAKDYFVHTFERLFPTDKYYDEHPEYYSLIDGVRLREKSQLCLTNPEVLEIAVNKIKKVIADNPDAKIISVSQNDNVNGCRCNECRAIDEPEGGAAGTLIHFVNAIAEQLQNDYPDILIDTLAYQYTRRPPNTIRPHPNVCVRLCTIECCFTHPLRDCHVENSEAMSVKYNGSFAEDLIGWGRVANHLYVWDYVTDFSHYLLPFPNFKVLADNIKFFIENNVKGVFEQGCATPGGSEMSDLRAYILANCLWDSGCDDKLLTEEFLAGVYGKAGIYIKKYLDTVAEAIEKTGSHLYCYDHPGRHWHSLGLVEECAEIFKQALTVAENEAIYHRVKKESLAVDYLRATLHKRGSEERNMLIDDLVKEAKKYGIAELWERAPFDEGVKILKGEITPKDYDPLYIFVE